MKRIFVPVILVAYEIYGEIISKLVPIVALPTFSHLRVVLTDPEIAARVQLQGAVAEELLDSSTSHTAPLAWTRSKKPLSIPSPHSTSRNWNPSTPRTFPDDAEGTIFMDAQSFANLFTNASKSSGTGFMLNAHLRPEFTEMLLERTRQNFEIAVHGYSH